MAWSLSPRKRERADFTTWGSVLGSSILARSPSAIVLGRRWGSRMPILAPAKGLAVFLSWLRYAAKARAEAIFRLAELAAYFAFRCAR